MAKRFLAMTGYCLSLPRKLLASQETYTAYAYTLSGPLVRVARRSVVAYLEDQDIGGDFDLDVDVLRAGVLGGVGQRRPGR
jgi:hypothetical protein